MKINKVKRKILIRNMVEFGLKPMSELVAIMSKFATVGPNANAKPIKAVLDEAGDEEERSGAIQENEELKEGEVSAKEYEYLLSMPMWSVTEERVEQLIRQMQEKKQEHDALYEKHIHTLWKEDLDNFQVVLDQVWEQEEKDRLKHGGVKNDGKKKGKKKAAPVKKGKP